MTNDQKLVTELNTQVETLESKLEDLTFKHSKKGRKLRKLIKKRNLLVGGAVQAATKAGELDKHIVLESLNKTLTSRADRALFGLPTNPANFNSWLEAGAPGCTLN